MFSKSFLQVGHIWNLLIIQTDNYVIDFDISTCSRTTFNDFRNPDSFYYTQCLSFICQSSTGLINRLSVVHQAAANRSSTDTEQSTLHSSILFQVSNNLRHNAGRNSKSISGISSGRRRKYRVDTYQFSLSIDQCTTTISLVNGSVCLDKRFYTTIIYTQWTRLCADDTGSYSRVKIERVTYCQYPLAYFQCIRVTYRNSRQIISFYFH